MRSLLQGLRFIARTWMKSPGWTIAVILTLALGIGASTAIFSVLHAVLLEPLPYERPSDLVVFWESAPQVGVPFFPVSEAGFHDWRERSHVFADMAGFRVRSRSGGRPMTVDDDGDPQQVNGVTAGSNLFDVLGVKAAFGRTFLPGEDQPGAAPVAVLSHDLWQGRYGADRGVLGRTIELDGEAHEIIGVLPEGFFFPPPFSLMGNVREDRADVFRPYLIDPDNRRHRRIRTVARLRSGFSIARAQAELLPLAGELHREHPDTNPEGLRAVLRPLHGQAVDHSRKTLFVLQGAVGLMLLIACVNVANLMLVRSAARAREIGVRSALGASRQRLMRQILLENLGLSLIGGLVGLICAGATLDLLLAVGARYVPQLGAVRLDGPVLLFAFLTATVTGLVCGLLPALRSTGAARHEALREGGQGAAGAFFRNRLHTTLVICEVALSVVLLVSAGLLLRSLWEVRKVDPGFNADPVLTARVILPTSRYPDASSITSFVDRLTGALGSLPEIDRVATVDHLPFTGGLSGGDFEIEGRPPALSDEGPGQTADFRLVSPGFFETLEIPLVRGRSFGPGDRADSLPVVMIDETLAARHWPGADPLGSRIDHYADGTWRTVVGVVGTVRQASLAASAEAPGVIYTPQRQEPSPVVSVVARTRVATQTAAPTVRRQLVRIDPDLPAELSSLSSFLHDARAGWRSPAILLALFATAAVLLALVGIYGLITLWVERRSTEIGLRLALGAGPDDILRMIGGQISRMVLTGIGLGLLAAFVSTRILSALLYSVSPEDPATYISVALLFAGVAAVSGYLPTRRALRVEPIKALRSE